MIQTSALPTSWTITEAQTDQQDAARLAQWLADRCGKLTASNMNKAIAFLKNGEPKQIRTDYQYEILAERLTGLSTRRFVTPAMQYGLEHEAEAKAAYSAMTGTVLINSGFYDHPSIDMLGATPDAEIGSDGLAEFKVPTSSTFIEWVLKGEIPEEHKPQMIVQLACTGRKWCEFVAYEPRIKDEKRRLFIRRYVPAPSDITSMELQAQRFLNEVDEMWEQLNS